MPIWYRRLGWIFAATGLLHTLLGFIFLSRPAASLWHAGLVDAIGQDYARATFFWFTCSGLLMLLLAYLMHWVLNTLNRPLPANFGLGMAALALAGGIIMPISGFWLVLVQGLLIAKGPGILFQRV